MQASTATSSTLHRSVCDGSAAGSKATNHSRHKSIVKGKKRYRLYTSLFQYLISTVSFLYDHSLTSLLFPDRHLLVASNSNTSASSDSTFASLSESAKLRLSASLQGMHGMFASSFRSAPHSPVKVYVSPSSSLATSEADHSSGNHSPVRKYSAVKGFTSGSSSGSAAAGITSPFVSPRQPGQREGNRRFSKEDLHDGHIINPNLAVSGLGKIEGHSPLEAWSGDHSPGHRASPYGTHNSSMVELFDAHGK